MAGEWVRGKRAEVGGQEEGAAVIQAIDDRGSKELERRKDGFGRWYPQANFGD